MSIGRTIGLGFLGLILGAVLGGVLGLLGGLGYTTLAQTSGFEGYSGFVVGYWIFASIILGAIAGTVFGAGRAGRAEIGMSDRSTKARPRPPPG